MKQVTVVLNINGLDMYQTIVLENEAISPPALVLGLENGDYITTVGHDRVFDDDSYCDVEVLDKNLNRVGYVKNQSPEDRLEIKEVRLIDSIDA